MSDEGWPTRRRLWEIAGMVAAFLLLVGAWWWIGAQTMPPETLR